MTDSTTHSVDEGLKVHGPVVDDQTRCIHWSSPRDIVAIQFHCCRRFYPCFSCHQQDTHPTTSSTSSHTTTVWPRSDWGEGAILCGVCKSRLSIAEYVKLYSEDSTECPTPSPRCPQCSSLFNPGCRRHLHLYFDIQEGLKD